MALSVLDCQKHIAAPLVSTKTGAPITIRKVPDGHGLFLIIRDGEPRRAFWTYQFRTGTGFSSKGFGPFPDVTPKQAREKVEEYKVALRNGTAPAPVIAPRAAVPVTAGKPFPEVVTAWLDVAAVKWAAKTRAAAERALLRLPLAAKAVNAITTDDVLASLLPLPERQRQDVRQNLARALDFAAGRKWVIFGADGNPARFENERRELWPAFTKSKKHHAAVDWNDAPALYKAIDDTEAGRALRFLILTTCRAGELEKATWSEVVSDNGNGLIWRRPADHMKLREEHDVPLTPAALAILGERGAPDAPLFKLASNAMLNVLQSVKGFDNATVHGLRSTFRDWAGDNKEDRDTAEKQLAHHVGDAVERAYSRSQWLARRRELLDKWTAHLGV
jgi:integrase